MKTPSPPKNLPKNLPKPERLPKPADAKAAATKATGAVRGLAVGRLLNPLKALVAMLGLNRLLAALTGLAAAILATLLWRRRR